MLAQFAALQVGRPLHYQPRNHTSEKEEEEKTIEKEIIENMDFLDFSKDSSEVWDSPPVFDNYFDGSDVLNGDCLFTSTTSTLDLVVYWNKSLIFDNETSIIENASIEKESSIEEKSEIDEETKKEDWEKLFLQKDMFQVVFLKAFK